MGGCADPRVRIHHTENSCAGCGLMQRPALFLDGVRWGIHPPNPLDKEVLGEPENERIYRQRYRPVLRVIMASARGLAPGLTTTLTSDGRPELIARSTAGTRSSAFSTNSACPPRASTTRS